MALSVRKISTLDGVNRFLNGSIAGGKDLRGYGNQLFLHGKTLVFNNPAGTVTFAATPAGGQVPISLADVLSQITAQLATVTPKLEDGKLALAVTAGGAVSLDETGTANAYLGFRSVGDTVGVVYNPPGGAAPALISIGDLAMTEETYLVVTEEP